MLQNSTQFAEFGQLEAGAISISSRILLSLHTPFRKNSFFSVVPFTVVAIAVVVVLFVLGAGT